ncbi:uncharacterized protein LOC123545598 [Mercenaria mercenaria]|uniref:uncharacterized protein LOC123545598 n=1 Tax=Mercenaria mercenaria TaxID=6596 RepID=UPI00234F3FA3|nr:uncharacterized protein LOC123545598 [Mercenaria mercenaria]
MESIGAANGSITGRVVTKHLKTGGSAAYIGKHLHYVPKMGICNNRESNSHSAASNGIKRKAEVTKFDDVFIPSKRVSPFLNTPKERKEVRKKVLIISIKKLKELVDPEAFLRKTVLINNTRKRLQTEFREEILQSKSYESNRRSYRSGYGELNHRCVSDSHMLGDPLLRGVHEKITDDMTDTLIDNVFHDIANNNIPNTDIGEQLNIVSKEKETTIAKADLGLSTSLNGSESKSDQSCSDRNITAVASRKECSILVSFSNRTDLQEMHVDSCDEKVTSRMCNVNNNTENAKNVCNDHYQAMKMGIVSRKAIKLCYNDVTQSQLYSDQDIKFDTLHPQNLEQLEKSRLCE